MSEPLDRREFLKTSSALIGGLAITFYLPVAHSKVLEKLAGPSSPSSDFIPNAFVIVRPDNQVVVIAKHLEMGQGTYTGLATIVAEEMDLDWNMISVQSAPADASKYNNFAFGPAQGTGGSSAMANSWKQLREAGATARAMLLQAAAKKWNVSVSDLSTAQGEVWHKSSGQHCKYGELVELAQTMTPPKEVKLKEHKDFKLIGTKLRRQDGSVKVNGKAIFALDYAVENKLYALVARPPRFGAKVKTVHDHEAKKIKGVHEVVQIPQGVAILADHFWQAKSARELLKIEWDDSNAFHLSSDDIRKQYQELLAQPGAVATNKGSVKNGKEQTLQSFSADYEFPFLAHAPMEVLNCVIQVKDGHCQIWSGDQFQTMDQANAARILGLTPQDVSIETLFAGGSFGRRANFQSDYISEAAEIAKATKFKGRAIHTVWTREDDIKGGYYRPFYMHRVSAGVDKHNKIAYWDNRVVGQSLMAGGPFDKGGIDHTSVEGISDLAYDVENLQVELHSPKLGLPVLWWRSVGHTHTAFVAETGIDELATLAKEDPLQFRLKNLSQSPRRQALLKLVAEKSGWGKPQAPRVGLGIAVHESFKSFVAQVAQVKVEGTKIRVQKVWAAVDCGLAVNPDNIRAQMEGAIGFALSAALHGEITLSKGLVDQSNFHDYQNLRINEMPEIDVTVLSSDADPTGVGEPGVPPLAPAVANAIFAATGKRLRKLPFQLA